MYTSPIRRIQLHLDEDLDEALAREALARRIPKAALIREYLAQHVSPAADGSPDPSDALIGIYDGGPDESAEVDDVVYGQ